jgi:hypothetical protein
MWMPLYSEWIPRRLPMFEAMHVGLMGAGFDIRVESLGSGDLAIKMLRVRCPHSSIELSEHWLLRAVKAYEDTDWASGVFSLLHQRWRDYPLFRGDEQEIEEITARMNAGARGSDLKFSGSRYGVVCSTWRGLFCYARSATEVVRCFPGVRVVGPEPEGDPRQWLAVDVAHDEPAVAELVAFGEGLNAHGFTTCRHEWREGRSAILTIDAGDLSSEELEARLDQRLPTPRPAWARLYRPWSWATGVYIHRHPDPEGWRLREWLECELDLPVVDAMQAPGEEVVLKVPPALVDRALQLLASRPKQL